MELSSSGPTKIRQTITAKRTLKAIQQGSPIVVSEGGTSSGKTYGEVFGSVLLAKDPEFRYKILKDKWPKIATGPFRISLVSHSLPHIKRGMLRDFRDIMQNKLQIWNEDQWRATDFIYTFDDGSYIELFGLEDPSRARGPRRDMLVLNEGNLVSKELFDQLAMRTTGPKIIDLNPSNFNCWCYDIADNPKNKKIHSTYLDNIENLHPSQIEYIEGYKNLPDQFMWQVYGLGQRGASLELIFPKWEKVQHLPGKGEIIYGLDFGYTNPSGLVRVEHYEGANYVEELIYEKELTKPELFAKIKALIPDQAVIYADAAEPDSIEELYRMGLNIKPAKKDVWAGIVTVKSYPLFIRGRNLEKEAQGYKWKTDKNGNLLEEPQKESDHLMDAMRYAIHTHLNKPVINWTW
ncbi:XtmB Phage terminase large subunit [uncultured Caudovirales phage]|uniref:XtmB Phage terminase large subunit n=1 Tax=uncultured Caudovirales phage TaxID=2100421 RepID=A0A6J5M0A8_9CAUD|nr:XtmB Phage terminase large subunit [uncultured Caudovirales phage]